MIFFTFISPEFHDRYLKYFISMSFIKFLNIQNFIRIFLKIQLINDAYN